MALSFPEPTLPCGGLMGLFSSVIDEVTLTA
jgi:hypothetical protein